MLVFRSQPLGVEWRPRKIQYSTGDRERIQSIIQLAVQEPEIVVIEDHLPHFQGLADPKAHPLDRLYAEGWKAVPMLIEELNPQKPTTENARILAALHNLTGMVSPVEFRNGNVLGSYSHSRGRMPQGSSVFSAPMVGKSKAQEPTAGAQEPLIKRWRGLAGFFDIAD